MDMYPVAVPLNAHASIVQVYLYTCTLRLDFSLYVPVDIAVP